MRWLMPEDRFFTDLNVPKLQYVPILIAEDGSYPIEPNTYVVERCCGEWGLNDDADPVVPTLRSRQGIASRLCAFFRFCHQETSLDWRCMTYQEHLIEKYQMGLVTGTCSATGKSLKPASVNVYVDEAVLFLTWAAERGHRSAFRIPVRRVKVRVTGGGNQAHSGRTKEVLQRHGKMQVMGDPLPGIPSAQEVARWLSDIRARARIKALQFELILRTGMRLSEANQMRLDCFPAKEHQGSEQWNEPL